jgi:hypothetical protein
MSDAIIAAYSFPDYHTAVVENSIESLFRSNFPRGPGMGG